MFCGIKRLFESEIGTRSLIVPNVIISINASSIEICLKLQYLKP